MTELTWRNGPIRVLATDFMAMGDSLPRTAGGTESPGQYIKRFRVKNEGPEPRRALFGVYIQAEINGGIGEPGLSWHDGDRTLLAINRGHGHANRKLARDATVEFALALDDRGEVHCEPTGANEAILLRWLDLPAGEPVTVDLLVSGAFTGWRGDPGTFEHWLRPALAWFRAADLDQVEQTTGAGLGRLHRAAADPALPQAGLRREPPPIGPGDRAARRRHLGGDRLGLRSRPERLLLAARRDLGRRGDRAAGPSRDRPGRLPSGWRRSGARTGPTPTGSRNTRSTAGPSGRRPAVDQTAMIPWGLERHYRRTGDLDFVAASWPMIEQAAAVCGGDSGHPGLHWIEELNLVSSAGIWDHPVRGLPLLERLRRGRPPRGGPPGRGASRSPSPPSAGRRWRADLGGRHPGGGPGVRPGRAGAGRRRDGPVPRGTRLSTLRGLWTDRPEFLDRSLASAWTSACSARPSRSACCPPPTPGSAPPPRRSSATGRSPATPNVLLASGARPVARRSEVRAARIASTRRLQPGHALDGPLPDRAGEGDGAGRRTGTARRP